MGLLNFSDILNPVLNFVGLKHTNKTNAQNVAATNQANLAIAREQNLLNKEMFDRQLQAGSAQQQVANLRAAGMNPSLSFNGASAGSIPSWSGAAGATMQAPVYSDVIGGALSQSASQLLQGSESSKYQAEAFGITKSNQYIDAEKQRNLEMMLANIEQLKSQKGLTDSQKFYYDALEGKVRFDLAFSKQAANYNLEMLDNLNMESILKQAVLINQQRDVAASAALKETQNVLAGIEVKFAPEKWRATIDDLYSQMSLRAQQGVLTVQEATNMFYSACRTHLGFLSDSLQHEVYKRTFPYIIQNAKNSGIMIEENIKNSRFDRGVKGVQSIYEPLKDGAQSVLGAAGLILGGKFLGKGITYGKKPYTSPNISYGSNPMGGYYY